MDGGKFSITYLFTGCFVLFIVVFNICATQFQDSKGLIVKSRKDLTAQKQIFAKNAEPLTDFIDIMTHARPTAIIGM